MTETEAADDLSWATMPTRYNLPPDESEGTEITHRNGFHALRKSNPTLYRCWRNHLRLCLDKYDHGYKSQQGGIFRANDKETLNYWLDRRTKRHKRDDFRRLSSLTLKDVEAHGRREATIYYTSSPKGKWALLMLDIDDKKGEAGREDVQAVQQYLDTHFHDHFNQISTGGMGWHGYIVVHYPHMTVNSFRLLVSQLEDALQVAVHARFKSTFEVKGKPGLLNAFGGYTTCGTIAKIPRLASEAEIADYMAKASRYYTPADLQAVIDRLTPTSLASLSLPSDIDMGTEVFRSKTPVPISVSEGIGKEAGTAGGTDPCSRMNRCGWQLTLRLKRPATAVEILDEYHAQGLNTQEDDDGNRRKLARESAEWCAEHYDPRKQHGFDRESAIELIENRMTPEIRRAIYARNRSQYTTGQLAACLHAIERSSLTRHTQPRLQYTVGNNSILTMFRTLEIPFDTDASEEANRKKLAATKSALVECGLAEVINPNWYRGKCKCYGLGPQHPRYNEYRELRKSLESSDPKTGIIRLTGR
jgi:hypothetical protein